MMLKVLLKKFNQIKKYKYKNIEDVKELIMNQQYKYYKHIFQILVKCFKLLYKLKLMVMI